VKAIALLLFLAHGAAWHAVRPGVWLREQSMAERGPLSSVKAIVVRLDPASVQFGLDSATRDFGLKAAWTIDATPASAILAVNAGQFIGGIPWGWVVQDGIERKPPGTGSLAMAFVVDRTGRASLVMPDEIAFVRAGARLAFQSYPALLDDGVIPWELQAGDRGVNLTHRDTRLAVCTMDDGSIAIALTRFTGLGKTGETMPWGPTVPEMADYMKSLGCQDAMLLDGGISSQLALRSADGGLQRWSNWRPVPLALVAFPAPGE
jgi:exopolysaccharide biosynthesis protein